MSLSTRQAKREKRMRRTIYFLIFVVGWILGRVSHAAPLTPEEAYEIALHDCIEQSWEGPIPWGVSNMLSLGDICRFSFERNRKVVITSNLRPDDNDSQHRYGNAWDFYLEYTGEGECSTYSQYRDDIVAFYDFRDTLPWWYTGFGIYVREPGEKRGANLVFHFDHRDEEVAWGFVNGEETTLEHAFEVLEEIIEKVCD